MNDAERWFRVIFPIDFKTVAKMQEQGFVYITKRDRDHRPTLVLECAKCFDCLTELNEKEVHDCIVYAANYLIDNLLMPGKVESFNGIVDLRGISAFNTPLAFIQSFALSLVKAYPTRVSNVFLIGLDIVMRTTYNIVYYLMPETSRNTVIIVGPSIKEAL